MTKSSTASQGPQRGALTQTIYQETKTLLLGFSQVFLLQSTLSGALILVGLLCNSWQLALLALLGCLVSRSVASLWREGLLGYNAVLCAIYWSGSSGRSWLYALLSVVLSVLFELLALYAGLIPLTAPFVLSVWSVVKAQRWRKVAPQSFNA